MATFFNESQTHNQVGGDQHVRGSIYNVNNNLNFAHPGMLQLAGLSALLSSAGHDDNILASLSFPEMFLRRGDVEQPHTNTCRWILELDQYLKWQAEPNGLLWIKGTPGSGKSTLMLFLHNNLRKRTTQGNGIDLEFFFSARGVLMQRTPIGMLRSLLNQLFRKDTDIRTPIRDFYEEKCLAFGRGQHDWTWQRRDLEELLSDAIISSAEKRHVTIFIDALDEAGEDAAREIAAYFHRVNDQVSKKSAKAKICISCRHYPVTSVIPGLEVWVEKNNHNDITDFVQAHLNTSAINDPDELQQWQTIISDLVLRANGLFQWVRLVVPMVEKWIFEHETPQDVSQWLHDVPQALADVYGYILEKVISSKLYSQTFLFFQWVCLAERPLSVQEMRYALAAEQICCKPRLQCHETQSFIKNDERMVQRVKILSGGLAEVVRESKEDAGTIQVVHQSVNDFLMAQGLFLLEGLSRGTSFHRMNAIDEASRKSLIQQYQAKLYWSCLRYLITDDVANSWKREGVYGQHRIELLESCPWIQYVSVHIFHHAEKAGGERREFININEEVEHLEQIVPRWIKMYKSIDEYAKGCPSLNSTILHVAAAANLIDMVEYLIQNKVVVNDQNGFGQTPFHVAILWGHRTVAELLLSAGASMTVKTRSNKTPLMIAAQNGHLKLIDWLLEEENRLLPRQKRSLDMALQVAAEAGESLVVQKLIDAGADVTGKSSAKSTILAKACAAGHERVVALLLAAGVDANSRPEYSPSALEEACLAGHEKIIFMLIAAGADVNVRHSRVEYDCALKAAILNNHVGVVRLLLAAGAKTEFDDQKSETALQLAVRLDTTNIMKLLLDAGADLYVSGERYENPLTMASAAGNLHTVKLLLDAGAHPDTIARKDSSTALYVSTIAGHTDVVRMLIRAGADPNDRGAHNGTALEIACSKGRDSIIRMLLEAGADVNGLNASPYILTETPLCIASENGYESAVRLLLKAGAKLDGRGKQGATALQLASFNGHREVVKLLLEAGADVNASKAAETGSALCAAVSYGDIGVIKQLLAAGADVNAPCGRLGNPLQNTACIRGDPSFLLASSKYLYPGREDLVKLLLEAGADVNAKGGRYGTALCAAVNRGNRGCAELLLQAGADINAGGGVYKDAVRAVKEHCGMIDWLATQGASEQSVREAKERITQVRERRERRAMLAKPPPPNPLHEQEFDDYYYDYPPGKTRVSPRPKPTLFDMQVNDDTIWRLSRGESIATTNDRLEYRDNTTAEDSWEVTDDSLDDIDLDDLGRSYIGRHNTREDVTWKDPDDYMNADAPGHS